MSQAIDEIDRKIAETQAELKRILKERGSVERSIVKTDRALAEQRQTLQAVLEREGALRGALGDLNKARDAMKADD